MVQALDVLTGQLINVAGALSAFSQGDGTALKNNNLEVQLAATGFSAAASTTQNFWAAADAVAVSGAAVSTGALVLTNDINSGNGSLQSDLQIASDAATVIGDLTMVAGGILQLVPVQRAKEIGSAVSFIGDLMTLGTIGFDNYSNYVRSVSPGLSSLINSIKSEMQSGGTSAAGALSGTTESSNWSAVQSGINTALSQFTTLVADEGTGSFSSDTSAEQTDLNNLQSSLVTFYNACGTTVTDGSLTASGNTVTTSGGQTGTSPLSVSLTESGDGTSATMYATSANGSVADSQTDTWSSGGNLSQSLQSTATDIYTQNTTSQSNGQQTTAVTGQGDQTILTNDAVTLSANTNANIQDVGATSSVTMGSASTLSLISPGTFTGSVLGYATGDTIDLQGIGTATSAVLSGSTLTVSGGTSTANLTLGGSFSNDQFIVGSDGNGGTDIYVTSSSAPTALSIANATSIIGEAINNKGQYVGYYHTGEDSNGEGHGFYYNGISTITIDVPGAGLTVAAGVNDNGVVVGYYDSASGTNAFIYNGSTFTYLVNTGENTSATGINDAGEVVGSMQSTSGGDPEGFLYANGVTTILQVPGGSDTQAESINNAGVVAGVCTLHSNGVGFTYYNGVYTILPNAPAPYHDVYDAQINDSGAILFQTLYENGKTPSLIYQNGAFSTVAPSNIYSSTMIQDMNDTGEYVVTNEGGVPFSESSIVSSSMQVANIDLSTTTFTAISQLNVTGWTKVSSTQFSAIGGFAVSSGTGTVYAASAGTYDLTTKTVSGTVSLSAAQTSSNVTLVGSAAGQSLTGGAGSDVLTPTAGAETVNGGSGTNTFVVEYTAAGIAGSAFNAGTGTNILSTWDGDLSGVTLSGSFPTLDANQTWVKMTAAQFAGLTTLVNQNTGGTHVLVEAGSDGTYDLTTKTTTGIFDLTAAGTSGVDTLVGNAAGETLTGGWGWDTFDSTTTNETLDGGTGTNNFNVAWQAASIAGTVINGVSGAVANIVHTWDADLSVITINTAPTLDSYETWVKMTNAQFGAFTTFTAEAAGVDLIASNAGTYNLSTKTVNGSGTFNMDASQTTANVTLIGNGTAAQTLTGGTGTDVLTSGNGAGDIMTAGTGATTMNAGTGNDTFNAGTSGNDTMNGGQGTETYKLGSTFGQDVINNIATGTRTTTAGAVDFGSGVTDEKLWFVKSGNNLVIDLIGTTDTLTIDNWYNSNSAISTPSQLSSLVDTTDSLSLTTAAQVATLVSAMAAYQGANSGFNAQTATAMPTDSALQTAITSNSWHH